MSTTKMNPPLPKDFRIVIAFDGEVQKFYVADTEFPGLILEDADAGRLITRLCAAAVDLLEVNAQNGWNECGLAPGQRARLVPVFVNPVSIAA